MSHGDPEDYFQFYPKKELPSLEKVLFAKF